MKWSWTRLQVLRDCPRWFDYQYRQKLKGRVLAGYDFGRRFHEAVEAYARELRSRDRESDLPLMREIAGRYDDRDLRECLERFAENHPYDWSLVVSDGDSVEREFERPLPFREIGGEEHSLVGRVDLVQYNRAEGALWVTDWKTSYQPPAYDPDNCPRQLLLYAWAMGQEFGAEQVVCMVDYVRAFAVEPVQQWELWTADIDLGWVERLIREALEEGRSEATPGGHCQWCPYVAECWGECDAAGPQVESDAERTAAEVLILEQHLKAQKNGLKAYVQEHGPVSAGPGRFDLWAASGGDRWTIAGRGVERTCNKRAALQRVISAAGIAPEAAEKAAGLLLDLVDFDKEKLWQYVPRADDPFAEEGTDGAGIDLSAYLAPLKPRQTFGWREEKT